MIRTTMTAKEIKEKIGMDYTAEFEDDFEIDVYITNEIMSFSVKGTDVDLDTIDMKVSTKNNEKLNDFIRNCSGNYIDILEDQGDDGKDKVCHCLSWSEARTEAKRLIDVKYYEKNSLIVVDSEDDLFSNSERY